MGSRTVLERVVEEVSIFASKTPRDLNHDPFPYRNPDTREPFASRWRGGEMGNGGNIFDPRPEFDHVQNNAPNPILVEFRVSRGHYGAHEKALAIRHYLTYIDGDVYGWKPEQRDHARRVLTRLSVLPEVSS